MKMANIPHAKPAFLDSPRCGATTRKGMPCKAPAMVNGRCRLHGGKSTGPRTPEGLERSRKANWKHGLYSAQMIELRRRVQALLRGSRAMLKQVEEITNKREIAVQQE